MNATPTQENRSAELTTPLGKDKLVLTRLDVVEGLSELFEIRVECLSADANIDFGPAIGQNASVRLKTVGGRERYFSGVMTEARWSGEEGGLFAYRVILRPW